MSIQTAFEAKSLESPDETHTMEHGTLEVVNLQGATIARAVFQPGWTWSGDIAPTVGTASCQVSHTGYVVSERFHVRMDDGREYDFGPGDAHVVAPGHDAWVVGEEPCTIIDFAATGVTASGYVGRCPCGVEFRVAGADQLDHLVAAVREHARSAHDHELSPEGVLADISGA